MKKLGIKKIRVKIPRLTPRKNKYKVAARKGIYGGEVKYPTKAEAKKRAKKLRKEGYRARVTKIREKKRKDKSLVDKLGW